MGTYVQLYTCFQYIITYDQVNHHASAYLASACGPGISTSKLPICMWSVQTKEFAVNFGR